MITEVTPLGINGVVHISFKSFKDSRGSFMEAFNTITFKQHGLPTWFVQDNISHSHKGTMRGLHIQKKTPQGKLIRAMHGTIVDYYLDLRPNSPTFKKLNYTYLRSPDEAIFIPSGLAHGFFSLTDSVVQYKCTTHYDKDSDGGVRYNDPEIGLSLPDKVLHVSTKDLALPSLMEYLGKIE